MVSRVEIERGLGLIQRVQARRREFISRASPRFPTIEELRTGAVPSPFFGGRFAGFGGRGARARDPRLFQQQLERERQRRLDNKRATQILKKAERQLLTPQEKAELQRITTPAVLATRAAPSVFRLGGLSPLERVRLIEQRNLEAERTKILSQQGSIDVKFQELEARRKVLQRLSTAGILLPGVAAKFNTEVQLAIKQQKTLTSKSEKTERKITSFKKPGVTRVVVGGELPPFRQVGLPQFTIGIPKTAVEVLPEARILREARIREIEEAPLLKGLGVTRRVPERVKVKPIEPIVGVQAPDIIGKQFLERTRQTLLGFGEIGAGLTLGGLGFGAGIARREPTKEEKAFVERLGRAAGITVAAPIAPVEATLAQAFSQTIGLSEEVVARILGRRPEPLKFPITEPTAKAIVRGAARIPFLGELLGAKEAVTPRGVFITRPVLTEFASTLAFFGAPAAAPRVGRLAVKVPTVAEEFAKVIKRKGKRPVPTKPFTPFQIAVGKEKVRLLGTRDILALPERVGIVPSAVRKAIEAEEKAIAALVKPTKVVLTKAELARQKAQEALIQRVVIPIEVAEIGARQAFTQGFLKTLGVTEKVEFAFERAIEPAVTRLTQAQLQARLLGLRGEAALITLGRETRLGAQRAALARRLALARGLTRADILFGKAARPLTETQLRARLLGLRGEIALQRVGETFRLGIQQVTFPPKFAFQRGLEVVITPPARVAARATFEAELIRLRAVARIAKGKAKTRILRQVAKIELKEATRRAKLAARKAVLPITEPISRVKAKALFEVNLARTIGKTAAAKLVAGGIEIVAKPTAAFQLGFQAPVRRFGFELGTIKPFVVRGIPAFEKRVRPKKVKPKKSILDITPSEFFEPDFPGFATIRRGRPGRQITIFQEAEVAPLRFAPKITRPATEIRLFKVGEILRGAEFAISKQFQGFGVRAENLFADSTINVQRDFQRFREGFKLRDRFGIRAGQLFRPGEAVAVGEAQISLIVPRFAFRVGERLGERQRLREITITVPRPRPTRRPIPIIIPFPQRQKEEELFRAPRKVPGFVAFVKEKPFAKKRFRKVSKVLPEEIALQRGFRVADLTIAQSVRLKRAKKKVRSQPRPLSDLRFKFRQKGKIFIEKRAFAIDTPTEKQELSVGRFLAQEKKGSGFFGGGKMARKRTTSRRGKPRARTPQSVIKFF